MFDIGWSELLVIAVVAIVVVGPKDLPKLMRGFGHYAGKLRRAASDFQRQFEEAMRESEIEEVRKAIESATSRAARPQRAERQAGDAAQAGHVNCRRTRPPSRSHRQSRAAKPPRKRAAKAKSPATRKAKAERAS